MIEPAGRRWRSQVAEIDGPVHYGDYGGEGVPIVMVHGFDGSHENWESAAAVFSPLGHCMALDLAGCGFTPRARRSASVDAHTRLLDSFLSQVCDRPAVLVGHSMGALVAMSVAVRSPERVAALVLASPPVPSGRTGRRRASDLKYLAARPILGTLAAVAATLRRESWRRMRFNTQTAASIARFASRRRRFYALVDDVAVPTFLVGGADDTLVRWTSLVRLHQQRPSWTFATVAAGHEVNLNSTFAELASAWIRGLPGWSTTEPQPEDALCVPAG